MVTAKKSPRGHIYETIIKHVMVRLIKITFAWRKKEVLRMRLDGYSHLEWLKLSLAFRCKDIPRLGRIDSRTGVLFRLQWSILLHPAWHVPHLLCGVEAA